MDAQAFDQYFNAKYRILVGQVTAMSGNRDDAAEAVQEAFVRAWVRRGAFGRHPYPDAWIRTVARNLIKDGWRRQRRLVALADETPITGPDVAERLEVHRALQELPPSQRSAMVLFYLADLPIDQIADELKAPAGTVRVWLSRGRARLGILLDDDMEPDHA